MTLEEFRSISGLEEKQKLAEELLEEKERSFGFESTEAYVTAMSIAKEAEKSLKKSEQTAKRLAKAENLKAMKEKPAHRVISKIVLA